MPIIHVQKTNHDFRKDRRLSYKARGILAYIMSHEHDWEMHVETLVKESDADGRIAVQSALKELLKWQYARLDLLRDKYGKVRGKQYVICDVPFDMQPSRQAGFVSLGTDKQVSRLSENLPLGTDKQVSRQSGNLLVGQQKNDVDTRHHRQAGFPSDGFPDSQETCPTKNQDLEKKENPRSPPYSPPPTLNQMESYRRMEGAFQDKPHDYTTGFLNVWNAWPAGRKQGKKVMWELWCHRQLEPRATEILAKIDRLKLTIWKYREAQFVPTPKTWFEEGRYDDDLVPLDEAPATRRLIL